MCSGGQLLMAKPKRSAAQQAAIRAAQDAHKLPADIISREYQVHLPAELAASFKALSPADRGSIILAGSKLTHR